MAGSQQQWAQQAAINALLRYRPQQEGLAQLQRAAQERFAGEVAAGKSEGQLGMQAAQGAVAPTQQIFAQAAAQGQRSRALTDPILSALSATSPFRAAAANDQAAGEERTSASQARALSDLQQRKVAASELPAFTRQAATSALLKELQALSQKKSALQGAEGADVQSEIDKQRTEAGKAALTERGQNLTSQSAAEGRRVTERGQNLTNARAEAKAKGTAAKPLTATEQNAGAATAAAIRQVVGKHGQGLSRAQLVAKLSEGAPEETVKEGTTSYKVPKIPAYKPNAVMAAGLDYAEYGHMTRNTEARLRREGYDPAKIGVPRAPQPVKTIGQFGKRVSEALPKL